LDLEEQRFRDTERLLNQSGYTVAEFLNASGRYKSTLLMMSDDYLVLYRELYDCIKRGGLSRGEKGKKLEELSAILFQKSVDSLFDVYKNCRTSTNEIDLLIRWTDRARLSGFQAAFPCFGDSFLCECKNYHYQAYRSICPYKDRRNLFLHFLFAIPVMPCMPSYYFYQITIQMLPLYSLT